MSYAMSAQYMAGYWMGIAQSRRPIKQMGQHVSETGQHAQDAEQDTEPDNVFITSHVATIRR